MRHLGNPVLSGSTVRPHPVPDEVCFDRTELGELLNLLDWLRELLRVADNGEGVVRIDEFIRLTRGIHHP